MTMTSNANELIQKLFSEKEIEVRVSNPMPYSDEGGWNAVRWDITFKGKRGSYTCEWKMGTACIDWEKASRLDPQDQALAQPSKNSTVKFRLPEVIGKAIARAIQLRAIKSTPVPAEVFAFCCRESEEAHGRSFEDWAGDCGLDPDSRKAEAIYRKLADDFHALARIVGEDAVAEFSRLASEL